ncbi:serine hydrolase [Streptomyces sp. NBC_00878]|uniref:serine hydrolase n=1 Tax=Streptomyces sp. NBC_00878 TaxID=2975854 RepID=UPI00224CD4DB|nr:serine hydrolase [Streptomyces sp. NBC_00878]MCX4909526.1 class A beta-lactamase-related serine hydrolase [Streptomyces sp. NBC_00878]
MRYARHCRTALVAALASVLLVPVPAVSAAAASPRIPAGATTRRVPADAVEWTDWTDRHPRSGDRDRHAPSAAAGSVTCHAPHAPALASRLSRDIKAALSKRRGTVSLAVYDDRGVTCTRAGTLRYDSASVVKVLIMEGLLRRAEELGRRLTPWEAANVRPMIVRSDNGSAVRLWAALGRGYLNTFLTRARTRATVLGPGGYWGLTRTTATDQMRLLGVLTNAGSFLRTRASGLKLLAEVRADQRWGVPAGMPRGLKAHVKNGWLPRATHGWRVHSIGAFTGERRTYRIVVLSHDNPTMAYGVRTIERIAQAVHRGLNPGRGIGRDLTPETEISEEPDGSAPYEPLPGWDGPEPDATA